MNLIEKPANPRLVLFQSLRRASKKIPFYIPYAILNKLIGCFASSKSIPE